MKKLLTALLLISSALTMYAPPPALIDPNTSDVTVMVNPLGTTGVDTFTSANARRLIIGEVYTVITNAGLDYSAFGTFLAGGGVITSMDIGDTFTATVSTALTSPREATSPRVDSRLENPMLNEFYDANPVPVSALPSFACGTLNRIAMFTPCGNNVGDSFIRQLSGDILWDDGVNDIITWDFITNPAGAIGLTIGAASGVLAIDNCLTTCFFPRATATDGELVNTCFFQCSDNFYGSSVNFNIGTATDHIQFTDGSIQLQPGNKSLIEAREDVGGADIIDVLGRFQVSGADSSFSLSKPGDFGLRAFISANNLTTRRWQEFADMGRNACIPATFAMWGQATKGILTDHAFQCSGAVVDNQSYEFTVASGACGCFSNVVSGCLSGVIPIGTTFVANLSCTPTNYDGSTIQPTLVIEFTSMMLTSTTCVAADATFVISPCGLVDAQIFDLEWACPTNRGELLNAGLFKMGGDWRPDQYDTLTLKWNGLVFVEQSRSKNN